MPDRPSQSDERDLILAGFKYAFSLTHRWHDAEDVLQQACLQVLRKKDFINDKAYLFVTIRNLFYDQCRRRALATIEPLAGSEPADSQPDHTRHVNGRLDVEAVLANLRSADRELLYLNSVEGFTAAEISELTGQPRGTILSQLSRVKQRLRDRYQPQSILGEVS